MGPVSVSPCLPPQMANCQVTVKSQGDPMAKYGVPSRVRTDHGGDLWRGVSNVYYDLFNFLESEGIIDIDNEMHMWALHYVYLPRINHDLRGFLDQWNNHGLRTERHQSPIQLFVQGCLERQGQTTSAMQSLFGGGQGDAQEEPEREDRADAGDVAQEEPEREGRADAGDDAQEEPEREGRADAGDDAQEEPEREGRADAGDDAQEEPEREERVTVPRNQHLLSDEDMEQLIAQFDPLAGRRGDLGLDVIQNILSFMATLSVV
ncbi:hypothetical protein JOQ06_014950 [Pogonophryne albipinna]|uniref:Integrase core domain-containing protein n=1 Tax=Pogonophryne albipinna TaxID=1090488 RepID=A0AAD6AKN0_9TELE|nr:hypothetical protein JOQ06_014950 [Pogonophryne albipinna]